MLGFLEFFLILLEKILYSLDELSFHEFEVFSGYGIIGIRILMYCYFLFYVKQEYTKSPKLKLRQFGTQIFLIGTFSFLTFPLLLIIAIFLPNYWRYPFVSVGLFI